jgi:hypothetical protein
MGNLSAMNVITAIHEPVSKAGLHSPEPLVAYLRAGGEVTRQLRDELVHLLDEKGISALQLRLGRRDTRRMSPKEDVDRNYIAYQRVQDLTGAIVTDALCQDILSGLPGWKLKHQRGYLLQRNDITEIRLRTERRVSKNIAIRIAAFQINKSFPAVKKMIAAVEALNRET